MRKLQNDRPNGENILASILAQFGLFSSQEGAKESKRTNDGVAHRHSGRRAITLGGRSGGVGRARVEGARRAALVRARRRGGRYSPARERYINAPFSAQNQLAVLTEWPSPRWQ